MASVTERLSAVARSAEDGERSVASAVDDCGDVGCGEVGRGMRVTVPAGAEPAVGGNPCVDDSVSSPSFGVGVAVACGR